MKKIENNPYNALKEIDAEFEVDKNFHFFALVIIVRFILEKENLKWTVEELDFSKIHKFLHFKSIESDDLSFLNSLVNLLIWLPEKYEITNILKKLREIIAKNKKDFLTIQKEPSSSLYKKYKIKVNSISVFSYNPLFYIYTGRNENDKPITFIYKERIEVHNVYLFEIGYGEINNGIKIFFGISHKNKTIELKKYILKKYNISESNDLFNLLKGKPWPNDFFSINSRELIADIISYFSNSFELIKDYKSLYPFLSKPYISRPPGGLSNFYTKKIINAHNIDNTFEKQYNLKKKMDNENIPCIEYSGENMDDLHLFEKKDNKIYYKEYLEDILRFETLFKNMNDNKIYSEDKDTLGYVINLLSKSKTIVIKGPAGYGKSYTIKKVIEIYKKNNQIVKLICPTWKAIGVYENIIESSTIAGLKTKETFFEDLDLIIIDEMSLIKDWSFIEKINNNTRLIISGDSNQLPPLNSLTKKYKWLINLAIRENKLKDLKKGKNYRINKSVNKDIEKIQKTLINEKFLHKKPLNGIEYIESEENIFKRLISLSKEGFIIITSNNGGIFGVDFLNKFMKNESIFEFSINDKIVFIKYFESSNGNTAYNGCFGTIQEINDDIYIIDTIQGIIECQGTLYTVPFIHAYAITAHKAQGSTIEKVVVLVDRNIGYDWLYTAYSRGSIDSKIIFNTNSFNEIKERIPLKK